MSTFSSIVMLGTLGVLSAAATQAVAAVDTSQWKCETCPFEKTGIVATVDAGLALVDKRSARFGDYTGLDRKGGYLSLGGELRYRGAEGYFSNVSGSTGLGSVTAEVGREGRYSVRLGYSEIPRHLSDSSATPFLGVGGASLTLPAGFPASTTGAMPLAANLQSVEIGTTRQRFELSAAMPTGSDWTHRLSLRRDVRDGLQAQAGSFFSTAAQLPVPVDQVTDQLELSTAYAKGPLHASLAYHLSQFSNGLDALTWANPFTPVLAGATRGQLALAPDNQFHQISAGAGYVLSPTIRASADVAVGRLTQDEAFLPATLNTALVVAALPQASLRGKVNTYNSSLRITATPWEHVRLQASYAHDQRENNTPIASYASVATDLFVGAPRSNTPFTFKQDRYKLTGEYTGIAKVKLSAGFEENDIHRWYHEAVWTREATVWAGAFARPLANLSVGGKLLYAERKNNGYGVATWVTPPENPFLRKFNLADRQRTGGRARADWAVSETVQLGVHGEYGVDDYGTPAAIGLKDSRSASLGADVSATLSDELSVHAFAQGDRIRSRQLGSQAFAAEDWSGHVRDTSEVVGVGIKYAKDKLVLGADLTAARSRSTVTMNILSAVPQFPTASTSRDSLKLSASYQLQEKLALVGNFWHERFDSRDWHVDGVLRGTVFNYLSLGEQAPRYRVNVLRVGVRYSF